MRSVLLSFLASATFLLMVVAGCKKAAPPPVVAAPPTNPGSAKEPVAANGDPSDKYAAAKATFRTQCSRCHSVTPPGEGGGRRGKGPSLAKVGGDPKHTKAWLSEHILNPKAHTEESRMPKFEGKIKDNDLKALVDYLASLK
jgi:mono/diheme cytochrome c family protein